MNVLQITPPSIEPVGIDELMAHLRIDDEGEYDILEQLLTAAREQVEDITRRALLPQVWEYYLQAWPREYAFKLPLGNLQSILSLTIADSSCVETNGTYDLIFTGACKTAATGTYTIAANVITAVSLTSGGLGYVTAPTVATQSGDGAVTATLATLKWTDDAGTETTLTPGTDYLIETNWEQCGRIVLPYGVTWPSGTLYPSNPIAVRFRCGWNTRAEVPYKIKAAVKMLVAELYQGRGEAVLGQTVSENKAIDRLLASERLWDGVR